MMPPPLEFPEQAPLPPGPAPTQSPPADLLDRLRAYQMPSQEEFVSNLTTMHTIQAVLLLAFGLVYLLQGWKIFKILVILNATVMGAVLGSHLGGLLKGPNMPVFGGIAGGLLIGVLSWPLMKYAISVMGGLAGSFLGYVTWKYAADAIGRANLYEYAWAGALVGLILMGMLAFVLLKLTVEFLTSFQGAMMAVTGLLGLLLKYEPLGKPLLDAIRGHTHLVPLLFGVPAAIGFGLQHAASSAKAKGKPAPK